MVQGWSQPAGGFPMAPQNVQVCSPLFPGAMDIRWDNPAFFNGPDQGNSAYSIMGVNIYRSDVSDRGPFHRVNIAPVGSMFYRDQTEYVWISNEVVRPDQWMFQANKANNRTWQFSTQCPIVKKTHSGPYQHPIYGNAPSDVIITINGVTVPADFVFGLNGEITLINLPVYDVATDRSGCATLPVQPTDVVLVSYYTVRNFIRSGLDTKLFYRLTTVAADPGSLSGLIETPLQYSQPISNIDIETLDWVWREAIRRNNWILEQGGERVKAFLRKQAGERCCCNDQVDNRLKEYSKQPSNRCTVCYGTGFVGGYEGPYDIIVAPEDGDRKISQLEQGRRLELAYEVWTGPTPLVTQRDFIVKQTNERYSIGPVRRPTNRGNVMQQHFQIGYLDEQDIRYRVMFTPGVESYTYPQTRHTHPPHTSFTMNYKDAGLPYYFPEQRPHPPYQPGPTAVNPVITEKENIPDARERRGRSQKYEDWTY